MSIIGDIINRVVSATKVNSTSEQNVPTTSKENKNLEEKFKSEIWGYLKSIGWQEVEHETYSKTVLIPSDVIVNGRSFEAPYLVEINDIGPFYEEINNTYVYLGETLRITIDGLYSSPDEMITSIEELKEIVKDIRNRNFA